MADESGDSKRDRITGYVNGTLTRMTPQQRTFLIEYLLHGNQTKAAEAAGYANPEKQGWRLAQSERVKAAIAEFFHSQEMTVAEVVALLSSQARAEYGRYLVWDEARQEVSLDVARMLADGHGHLIAKIGYARTGQDSYRQVIEFESAYPARVSILRYHGKADGGKGGEDEPVHHVHQTVDEWRAEQERRRAAAAATLELFEGEDAAAAD